MGLCGYNESIGNSVRSFAEGMIESMTGRSEREQKPIDELVDGEIEELTAIINDMKDKPSASISGLVREIDTFALSYFLMAKKLMNEGLSFKDSCLTIATCLNSSLYDIDIHHKSIRNDTQYKPTDLSEWIAKQDFER